MKVQFLKTFRDGSDRKHNPLGQRYLATQVADFPKRKADELIKAGVARKYEDKDAAPKAEETK